MKKTVFRSLQAYFQIAAGSFILAIGLVLFLAPLKLSSGGVSTIATVLLYLLDIPLSVTTLIINAVLFLFGFRFLGKASLLKTVTGIMSLSLFLEITSYLPILAEDIFIATTGGGALMGIGIGLAVRQEASTGGSDFAALILNRFFPHVPVPTFIFLIDCFIIAGAGLVFRSLSVTFYSAIALLVSMQTTNWVLSFGEAAKSLFILSERTGEISACIREQFSRGTTGIYSKGMYSDKNTLMLFCVVSPKEFPALVRLVRRVDKTAFIVISDVREVLGEGFKAGTVYDSARNRKTGR
ncbi:MAG: YitT family protein [Ruminococcaceae bacterium]|nr:YitT family protein [Oscillospiraceae bacterium]